MAGLSISEDDDSSFLGHLYDVSVILRAHRVGHLYEPLLIGGAIGECITDKDSAILPCPRKTTAFRHGRIIGQRIGGAGVHHHPHYVRLVFVPRAREPVTVAIGRATKDGAALYIMLEGEADLPARLVLLACHLSFIKQVYLVHANACIFSCSGSVSMVDSSQDHGDIPAAGIPCINTSATYLAFIPHRSLCHDDEELDERDSKRREFGVACGDGFLAESVRREKACVRSFAFSLERILRMCPLTVSSEITRRSATVLLEHPSLTMRSTSISRADRASEVR